MSLDDYHGIRTFLSTAFGQNYTSVIDAGEIAKLITEDFSEDVGTTVKTEGESSDPYGYSAIIPLSYKSKGVDMLKKFWMKSCKDKAIQERLQKDLEKHGTSIVFMDKFVNLPAEISSPLLRQLIDDLKNACKEDATLFETKRVIISTPTYVEIESDLNDEQSKKKKKVVNAEPKYYYEEAEILDELAEYSWDYKVDHAERVTDSKRAFGDLGIESGRRVFILDYPAFLQYTSRIETYIQ